MDGARDGTGRDGDARRHPLERAAEQVAGELLVPHAAAVDQGTVPRSHLDALGRAGLLATAAPQLLGMADLPAPAGRRVVEVLAGADLATWFVQAQHHGPVAALAASGGFRVELGDLARGRKVAGVAFSHLRRWPRRPVQATRDGDGWRFDGTAPWYTGWGLNQVMLLSGVDSAGTVVHALVPATASSQLKPTAPIEVAAVQAAVTVALELTGLRVGPEQVVRVQGVREWADTDALRTVNVNPAVFGVTGSALWLLHEHGVARQEPAAVAAAERIESQVTEVREQAYHLMDHVAPQEETVARLSVRARAHRLMIEATTALVIAGAGSAMSRAAPAQRKAREAMFLLVQAQTAAGRRSALDAWGR